MLFVLKQLDLLLDVVDTNEQVRHIVARRCTRLIHRQPSSPNPLAISFAHESCLGSSLAVTLYQ